MKNDFILGFLNLVAILSASPHCFCKFILVAGNIISTDWIYG
jgi:hypothetical protein